MSAKSLANGLGGGVYWKDEDGKTPMVCNEAVGSLDDNKTSGYIIYLRLAVPYTLEVRSMSDYSSLRLVSCHIKAETGEPPRSLLCQCAAQRVPVSRSITQQRS